MSTKTYKLVALGDSGVGKTALITRYCQQHFIQAYDPTIEDSYRKQDMIDGRACIIEVLDTAGHEQYNVLCNQWIRNGQGFLLVYSISSQLSFTRMRSLYEQIHGVEKPVLSHDPPVVLVGNKSDHGKREVSVQEGHALARELGCEFVETSAKEGTNIAKPFDDLARLLRRQEPAAKELFKSRMHVVQTEEPYEHFCCVMM